MARQKLAEGDGSTMARILIVEPRSSGHLLVYVAILVHEARKQGLVPVLALGQSVRNSPEYREHLAAHAAEVAWFEGPLTASLVNRLASELEVQHVVIPHGDEFAAQMGVSASSLEVPTTTLVMRDPRAESGVSARRWSRNTLKWMLIRGAGLRRHIRVVWLRGAGAHASGMKAVDPYIATTDGADTSEIARSLPPLDGTFWFTLTGSITDRKNLPLVIDAVAQLANGASSRVGLAAVGPLRTSQSAAEHMDYARERGVNLVILDQVLSNDDMNEVIDWSDAVVVAYSTHAPNSTVVKCFVQGARLVVAGPTAIRTFAAGLGYAPTALTVEGLVASMSIALNSPKPAPQPNPATPESFANALLWWDM